MEMLVKSHKGKHMRAFDPFYSPNEDDSRKALRVVDKMDICGRAPLSALRGRNVGAVVLALIAAVVLPKCDDRSSSTIQQGSTSDQNSYTAVDRRPNERPPVSVFGQPPSIVTDTTSRPLGTLQVASEPRIWHFSKRGKFLWDPMASSGVSLSDLRFGDFNGDGATDVFTTFPEGETPEGETTYRWWYSPSGRGRWTPLSGGTARPKDLRFGDFDGDGKTDVFYAWPESVSSVSYRWKYSSGGIVEWKSLAGSNAPPRDLRFGDFDGDVKTDVFHAWPESVEDNKVFYRWNYSSGGAREWKRIGGSAVAPEDLRFGDFDGDGKTDVFSAAPSTGGSYDWQFSPGGSLGWDQLRSTRFSVDQLKLGDFDGDETTDVLTKDWKFYPGGKDAPVQLMRNDQLSRITFQSAPTLNTVYVGNFDTDEDPADDLFTSFARRARHPFGSQRGAVRVQPGAFIDFLFKSRTTGLALRDEELTASVLAADRAKGILRQVGNAVVRAGDDETIVTLQGMAIGDTIAFVNGSDAISGRGINFSVEGAPLCSPGQGPSLNFQPSASTITATGLPFQIQPNDGRRYFICLPSAPTRAVAVTLSPTPAQAQGLVVGVDGAPNGISTRNWAAGEPRCQEFHIQSLGPSGGFTILAESPGYECDLLSGTVPVPSLNTTIPQ